MNVMYVKEIEDVWFAVVLNGDTIVASSFSCQERSDVVAKILSDLPLGSSFTESKPEGTALDVLRNMHHIYKGTPMDREFQFDLDRLPPFTKKALLMTYRIPRGFVATYKGIAEALGNKDAARAVGNAEARNPFAPIIPCHRVVSSSLGLGGYGGGLQVKRAILEREGVVFRGNRVSAECLWNPQG